MARVRTQYQFGHLVETDDMDLPQNLRIIQDKFNSLGINVPLLSVNDLHLASAFLECLKLWRGSPLNPFTKSYPIKGHLLRRCKLRKALSQSDIASCSVRRNMEMRSTSLTELNKINPDDKFADVRKQIIREKLLLKQRRRAKEPANVTESKEKIIKIKNDAGVKIGSKRVNVEVLDLLPICKVNPMTPSTSKKMAMQSAFETPGPACKSQRAPVIVESKKTAGKTKVAANSNIQAPVQDNIGKIPSHPFYSNIRYPPPPYSVMDPPPVNSTNTGHYKPVQTRPNNYPLTYAGYPKVNQSHSRIRLTIPALEALIQYPDKFHKIKFGHGEAQFFKKAKPIDRTRYNGEFFAAKLFNQEHYFIALKFTSGQDCNIELNCQRRDCPIHLSIKYKIDCSLFKDTVKSCLSYRVRRLLVPPLTHETYLSHTELTNFNRYIESQMPIDIQECYQHIYGKRIPLLLVHALVQLRQHFRPLDYADWCEMVLELEVLPNWPLAETESKRFICIELLIDRALNRYSRNEYVRMLQSAVRILQQFYIKFESVIKNVAVGEVKFFPNPTLKPNVALPFHSVDKGQQFMV